jgi:hypothetical protein
LKVGFFSDRRETMTRNRQSLITGLGVGLLFGLGPAATRATILPARLHPAGTIDTSFGNNTQQPGQVITALAASHC